MSRSRRNSRRNTQEIPQESAFSSVILEQFRKTISQRASGGGIRRLGRIFRRMDDNHNNNLSLEELQSGLNDYGLRLNASDLRILFLALDKRGEGSVTYSEFLGAVRGPMNRNRQKWVDMAFNIADRDNSGIVDFKDIAMSYDAGSHPDVQAGRITADHVFDQFLEKWERNGVRDGKVTLEEFREYYNDVSASIDSDEYFELMIKNAWHIVDTKADPRSPVANTSNLRVLVEFVDGRQEIIAIQNDLGLDKSDVRALRSALRRQGYSNIAKIRTAY